jgi:hypothetical protein
MSKMLIDNYKDFLEKLGHKPSVVSQYTNKLNSFFRRGYSEADLVGGVDNILPKYAPRTELYQKDHGQTYNALKKLNEYLIQDFADTLYIKCDKSPQMFSKRDKHWTSYEIRGRNIEITYSDRSKKSAAIDDLTFYILVKFVKRYKNHLSNEGFSSLRNVPSCFDYTQPYHFDYVFEEKSCEDCEQLFVAENKKLQERLNSEYRAIISPFLL